MDLVSEVFTLLTCCADSGSGWFADNLWLQGVALTLDPISTTFNVDSNRVRYTTMSLFIGLCIGASVWGIGSDIVSLTQSTKNISFAIYPCYNLVSLKVGRVLTHFTARSQNRI